MKNIRYPPVFFVRVANKRLTGDAADSANPLPITRDAWLEVAQRSQVCAIEIEAKCSDSEEL